MKTPSSVLLCLILANAVAPATAADDQGGPLRITAEVDKSNAVLTVVEGDVCKMHYETGRNGLCAQTHEFKSRKLQVMATFADSVTEKPLAPLRKGSGIVGSLQCKRVRMGMLPDIPQLKEVVIADDCTIKALKNT